jgi:uncharacterized protein YijF (DUF1287 family)
MSQQRTQQSGRQGDRRSQQMARDEAMATRTQADMRPVEDLVQYVREYTRQRPETVAIACFAVGFILGWRLKPW